MLFGGTLRSWGYSNETSTFFVAWACFSLAILLRSNRYLRFSFYQAAIISFAYNYLWPLCRDWNASQKNARYCAARWKTIGCHLPERPGNQTIEECSELISCAGFRTRDLFDGLYFMLGNALLYAAIATALAEIFAKLFSDDATWYQKYLDEYYEDDDIPVAEQVITYEEEDEGDKKEEYDEDEDGYVQPELPPKVLPSYRQRVIIGDRGRVTI
ncbi:hypothetical protein PVAG01_02616 [Phlyctema vagabunda]|uniref:Uncharacterized protein n=1 Tax=Phlyctema vagabunda TaxID=108571 RepID=A0ABR4PRD7_9HELO